MKRFVFCVLGILVAAAAHGQDFAMSEAKRARFLEEAVSHILIKADTEQVQDIEIKVAKWKKTNADEDWIKVTDAVYRASKVSGSKSEVTISTSGGDGAMVKYQTLGQRRRNETPTTAKGLTVTVEQIYIGLYHIWSERKEGPTSDKNDQFDIVGPIEKVILMETN